jgi:predicted PurR-regulated permease PerM
LIIPPLIREGGQFFADFPVYLSKILTQVAEFGERFGIQIPDRDALLERFQNQVRKLASPAALGSAAVVTQRFMAGAGGVLHALFEILILPIFLFLSLKNLPAIQHNLWTLLAPRWRAPVAQRLRKIDNIFAGFIRGQLVVASILACIFSVGLPLLGVKFGFFIGILSGLLNMVPFLGQAIGFLLSMLMVLADFPGWGRVIGIPIFFVVVNFLEGHFLTPKVVGDRVGLTPLQAILALLIGASLAGIVGMIIALPIAGSLKVLWRDLVHWYRHSDFYRKGSSHHTPG